MENDGDGGRREEDWLEQRHPRGGYNSDDITKVGVGGGAVEPGGSDDGMMITITISSGSSGKDDSELQAILAKCVKK